MQGCEHQGLRNDRSPLAEQRQQRPQQEAPEQELLDERRPRQDQGHHGRQEDRIGAGALERLEIRPDEPAADGDEGNHQDQSRHASDHGYDQPPADVARR